MDVVFVVFFVFVFNVNALSIVKAILNDTWSCCSNECHWTELYVKPYTKPFSELELADRSSSACQTWSQGCIKFILYTNCRDWVQAVWTWCRQIPLHPAIHYVCVFVSLPLDYTFQRHNQRRVFFILYLKMLAPFNFVGFFPATELFSQFKTLCHCCIVFHN